MVLQSPSRSNAALLGVPLGLAGALLDFYSSYQILSQSAGSSNGMVTPSGLAWGVGISALGVVLLATSLASATSMGVHRMKAFGAMMALYGLAMLFIGVSMYWGITQMMAGSALSGIGMLSVGTLMIVNGTLMQRTRAGPTVPDRGRS